MEKLIRSCLSLAVLVTFSSLKGMQDATSRFSTFEKCVDLIVTKHSHAVLEQQCDAMAAVLYITKHDATLNPLFISNHIDSKSYHQFQKLNLVEFMRKLETTITENNDPKDPIDLREIQCKLAAHNDTIVFTKCQLKSNPDLLNSSDDMIASYTMSLQKSEAQFRAESARTMTGAMEMIPKKEKLYGDLCPKLLQ